MLEIFFKDIPSIVFEPIVVFGWLGLLTALILYRKQRSTLYLTVAFSLAFMIFWRMAIQIVSSRYAEILIFPMSIAAAFFIFQLEHILKKFSKIPEKFHKYIPVCILIILALVCIGKNLRFHPASPLMEACRLIKTEGKTKKCAVYVFTTNRAQQIEYYSRQKTYIAKEEFKDRSQMSTLELYREAFRHAAAEKKAETIYIFDIISSKKKAVSAKDVGLDEKNWSLFFEKFYDYKHRKILRIYKYSAPHQ